jgi:tRNA-2-methylthio-N6-dimethylallyladenosine synthase
VIVGFPAEDESDYALTRDLVERIQFDNAFIFRYSTRAGTPAATAPDQLPERVKDERNQDLLKVVDQSAHRANERLVGREVDILCEGPSRTNAARLMGRTGSNKVVVFEDKGDRTGELMKIRVEQANGFSLYGTPLV